MDVGGSKQSLVEAPLWRRTIARYALALAYGFVVAVAVAVALSPSANTEQRLLLAAIAVVVLGPTLHAIGARRFDYFSPQTIFAAAWGMMFLARPVAMLYSNIFAFSMAGSPAEDVRPGFTTMLVAALLGAIAFQVGYFLRSSAAPLRPSRAVDWDDPLVFRLAVAFGALGTLLFAVFILHSGIHHAISALVHGRSSAQAALYQGSSAYLYDGIYLLTPATLLLVARLAFGGDRHRRLTAGLAWVFGALLVMRALASGGRTALLFLLGALLVFYFLRRGTRPRFSRVVIFLVASFLVVSVIAAERHVGHQSLVRGTVLPVIEHPLHQVGVLLTGGDTSMASAFALETEIVPSRLHYRYGGATLGDLVIRPIPHQLWKNKPLAPEAALSQEIWPGAYRAGLAHPVYSVMGTFYFDLGLPGVVVGMLLIGLGYGLVRSRLLGSRDTGLILVTAAVIPLLVTGLRDSFPDTIVHGVFVALPLVAAVAIVRRRVPVASEGVTEASVPRTARGRTSRRTLEYGAIAVLIGVAVLVAALGRARASAGTTPVRLHGVTSYEPTGLEAEAFGSTAVKATDGDPTSAWTTRTYLTTGFDGLTTGVGLVLSAPGPVALKSLTITSSTPGFSARIEAGNSPSGPFIVDSATQTVGRRATFLLDGKSGSYWLVWLTQLGPQLKGEIENVTAKQ